MTPGGVNEQLYEITGMEGGNIHVKSVSNKVDLGESTAPDLRHLHPNHLKGQPSGVGKSVVAMAERCNIAAGKLYRVGKYKKALESYLEALNYVAYIDRPGFIKSGSSDTPSSQNFSPPPLPRPVGPACHSDISVLRRKIYLNVAQCYLKLKRFALAAKRCTLVLEQEPDNVKALYRRGLARMSSELCQYESASTDLGKAASLNPQNKAIRAKYTAVISLLEKSVIKGRMSEKAAFSGIFTDKNKKSKKTDKNSKKQNLHVQPKITNTKQPDNVLRTTICKKAVDNVTNFKCNVENEENIGISSFFSDSASPVALSFSTNTGRRLVAKRRILRGHVALAADAYAVTYCDSFQKNNNVDILNITTTDTIEDIKLMPSTPSLGFGCKAHKTYKTNTKSFDKDDEAKSLVLAILRRGLKECEAADDKNIDTNSGTNDTHSENNDSCNINGLNKPLNFDDIIDLVGHENYFRKSSPVQWQKTMKLSRKIYKEINNNQNKRKYSIETISNLFLRVRFNSYPIVLAASRRRIGLGLFPAAAYVNHACLPNATYYFLNAGQTIVFRALRDIPQGEELTISYIDAYQPRLQRQQFLRDAYFFNCCCKRCASSLSDKMSPDWLIEAAIGGKEKANEAIVYHAGELLQRGLDLISADEHLAALRCLLEVESGPVMTQLHQCHFLRHSCVLAIIASAKRISNLEVVARYTPIALKTMEDILPIGTPRLAALYGLYGHGLMRLLRTNVKTWDSLNMSISIIDAAQRAISCLTAAMRIRAVCFGDEHPCVVKSRKVVKVTSIEAKALSKMSVTKTLKNTSK